MAADKKLSELSNSDYAARRKKLLSHVQQLRAIGAQADLDLPRITVIGNQSAGKSSVVEAISGITVPRDAGTCTRCPMECRLSSSDGPWSCRVSIRWEFDKQGKPKDKVSEKSFGTRITDKSKVEVTLRRAQAAVLNPHIPIHEMVKIDIEDLKAGRLSKPEKSLLFSRNVVCVDLEGPDLTDLSFIDLPGIIQNAEPEIVKLVEELVVSHIKGNSLILVALPMTDDIENQKALRLAHQEDPAGQRTIGVITKPDMLTSGSTKARELWLDVIEGRRHILAHGYYCTRQPDDAERSDSISSAQARQNEKHFFETTEPWSTSDNKHRFGTQNLILRLSDLLVQVINSSLPKLRSETSELLRTCRNELGKLPMAVDMDPATHMLNLITALCDEIRQYVRGGTNATRLIQENREAFATLKTAIRRTAPNFMPFVDARQEETPFENFLGDGLDEGPAEGLVSEGNPFYLEDMRTHIKKSITRELPNSVPFEAKLTLIKAFQSTWEGAVQDCFDSVCASAKRLLKECIKKRFGRYESLLSHIRSLISEFVEEHAVTCRALLQTTLEAGLTPFTQNKHYLDSATDKWLAKYKDLRSGKTNESPSLEPPSKRQKRNAPDPSPSSSDTLASGEFTFRCKPTVAARPNAASQSPDPASATVRPPVRNASQASPVVGAFSDPEKVANALSALAELGYTGLIKEDLGKLNPPDEYEIELKVMAEVRGYFQVSYKRIIDNVPSFIDFTFVNAMAQQLQPFLITKLGLGTANARTRCETYLAENPGVVARRAEFLAQKERLERVEKELFSFGL